MKQALALIVIVLTALVLTSCSKNDNKQQSSQYGTDAAGEAVSKVEEIMSTAVKDKTKLENLTAEQSESIENLGKTQDSKKIVAYIDSTSFSTFYYCEFESNKLTKAVCHRFAKLDSLYNSLKNSVRADNKTVILDDETKCLSTDETDKYKDTSYKEMLKNLKAYTIVK